eukprot:scaffold85169_cov34-Phaeocystis_antarctica.AAC.2
MAAARGGAARVRGQRAAAARRDPARMRRRRGRVARPAACPAAAPAPGRAERGRGGGATRPAQGVRRGGPGPWLGKSRASLSSTRW